MLWAAMLLCFFGFFRSGEICAPPSGSFNDRDHLTFPDVLVDNPTNPQQLRILLKRSKTDQARKGAIVGIGRTGGQLCPVAAVLSWMVRRGNAPGPLLSLSEWSSVNSAKIRSGITESIANDRRGPTAIWRPQL